MEEIVNRIKLIQQKSGLGNADFAEKLEISPATLTHLYNGRNKPSLHIISQISRLFNISTDEIISGNTLSPPIRTEDQPSKSASIPKRKKRISSVITTFDDGTFEVYYPNN